MEGPPPTKFYELQDNIESASDMATGSEGTLLGWNARERRQALVQFWDGGPLRVPADAIEKVQVQGRFVGNQRSLNSSAAHAGQ
jgi:hypothetical protein